ncbi:MAG: DUF2207 domain-containing protein [Bacteroidales bacterium]|nr:DUF2207 domain-containing protein [Bacteroidales bacterium]
MRRFLLPVALLIAASLQVMAQSVENLSIRAVLHKDGSASITQKWAAEVVSGTEYYIPISNLKDMSVSDLRVSEGGVEFVSEGTGWDVHRSIREKAGRCGIVDKGSEGVELCWGVGEYGKHVWNVSYELSGLVQALQDYDAFNFQFVNPGLAAPPQQVRVLIDNDFDAQWTDEDTREWGFGCDGTVDLVDGKIVMESNSPLSSSQYVNLMLRFNKGIFSPAVSRDIPFEKMQNKAFKGSDYSSSPDWGLILFGILFLLMFGGVIFGILFVIIESIRGRKYSKKLLGERKVTGWFREAPLDKDIPASYYVLNHCNRFGNTASNATFIIGAYFLKWILSGFVSLRPDPKSTKRQNLQFIHDPKDEGDEKYAALEDVEKQLYDMVYEASGDGVLESNEFKRWANKHVDKVALWPKKVDGAGLARLLETKALISPGVASETGAVKMRNVIEFKNFLNDFTLSSERGATEVGLWKDYLVYAQLFGIADKVAKQFQKLYPAEFAQLSEELGVNSGNLIWYINYNNTLSGNIYRSAFEGHSARRLSSGEIGGFGGGMSFGGGGGFSGGGFGGGSR